MSEPSLPAFDKVRSLVVGHAHLCLGELLRSPEYPHPEVLASADAGWTALLMVSPLPPGERGNALSACDRDCLGVLSEAQEVLSAPAVRSQLEKQGRRHAGITVKRTLRRLVQLGVVAYCPKQTRGYCLCDHGPLFPHPAPPQPKDVLPFEAQGSESDRVRVLIGRCARDCLGDLVRAGVVPRPEVAICAEAGWSVLLLLAFPSCPTERVRGLSACDRDCLFLLSRAEEPLSASRVCRELEKRGKLHAGITVKRSLRHLTAIGAVGHCEKKPRGYCLRDHGPLFRPSARS
jgi:Fe2+ or Zn2+ uptake regulation protein